MFQGAVQEHDNRYNVSNVANDYPNMTSIRNTKIVQEDRQYVTNEQLAPTSRQSKLSDYLYSHCRNWPLFASWHVCVIWLIFISDTLELFLWRYVWLILMWDLTWQTFSTNYKKLENNTPSVFIKFIVYKIIFAYNKLFNNTMI